MIITVTPNPGLDLTYTLLGSSDVNVDVHRATSSTLEASGKGVNVSRALAKVGVPTCAVLPLGGPTGRALAELLDDEGVSHRITRQARGTRVNTTALRPRGETLKLNGPGGALSGAEQHSLLHETSLALEEACHRVKDADQTVWVAVCGSLPPGVGTRLVADLVELSHRYGAKCAVDASGAALAAALTAGADLLAPNRLELSEVSPSAQTSDSIEELAEAARVLSLRTKAELLISLGGDGALYTDGRQVLHAFGPPLTPVNTAGAGDALLAGWLSTDAPPRTRLERALSWGRSACLTATTVDPAPGTGDTASVTVRDLTPAGPPDGRANIRGREVT